ncbi:hypothetical protein [Leminorella grimontii]|uniref:hypothetical protein n=1 Tax=Leminorella grimontii TaxID=82981 RepID=UPI0020831D3B|nr:hypothetical protein [Leminorella grimontii]GKX60243.1 hypothetical protein SOASR031_25580 [Leminorella grimontii]
MIDNKDVARNISELMLRMGGELNDSLFLVKARCNEDEYLVYKKQVANLMGDMLLNILNPLYKKHPDIKPKELN